MILGGEFGLLIALLAIVCSSWSIVNRGTAQRDELVPWGQSCFVSVRRANKMVSRTGTFFPRIFIRRCLMIPIVDNVNVVLIYVPFCGHTSQL